MKSYAVVTPAEMEELERLRAEYDRETKMVLHIMSTMGTNAETLPEILLHDKKAGVALNRIREIYKEPPIG